MSTEISYICAILVPTPVMTFFTNMKTPSIGVIYVAGVRLSVSGVLIPVGKNKTAYLHMNTVDRILKPIGIIIPEKTLPTTIQPAK